MSFDPNQWAANIFGCSRQEAAARVATASAQLDREEFTPEAIEHGGSVARIRARARSGDRDALRTSREIDLAFAACEQARRTGTPCPHCNH